MMSSRDCDTGFNFYLRRFMSATRVLFYFIFQLCTRRGKVQGTTPGPLLAKLSTYNPASNVYFSSQIDE